MVWPRGDLPPACAPAVCPEGSGGPCPCPCPCPTLSPAPGKSERARPLHPGALSHRVQGLVCPQSRGVGVLCTCWEAAPQSSLELGCGAHGGWGEGRAQEVPPVPGLSRVLSAGGPRCRAALSLLWSLRVINSYVNTLDCPHKCMRWGWQLGRAELCPDWLGSLNWSLPVPYHPTSLLAQLRVPKPP